MKKYCEECGKEVGTKVVFKKETYDVCGEPIEVDAQILVCAECGEEFYCEEFDNATLINAYNEYRRKHKLLLPEEIKKIREFIKKHYKEMYFKWQEIASTGYYGE